jgi:hypothetical protein
VVSHQKAIFLLIPRSLLRGVFISHLIDLLDLNEEVKFAYEDGTYRFYHQSYKVYDLQNLTTLMVELFQRIAQEIGRELNPWFLEIITEGTGLTFKHEHNNNWLSHTQTIVGSFLHAKYFMEMMINHGLTMETVLPPFKSGWAAILILYNQR